MRPIMIEFTGTPEAGKTTVIHNLQKILEEQHNLKVAIIQESAELQPKEFTKGSWDANFWMRYITCANVLHSLYLPCDIVIIDRGVIDLQFFGVKFFKNKGCSTEEYISYMNMFPSKLYPDYLIALCCNPETALSRRGGPGRIVNFDFIKEYNELLHSFYETITIPKSLIDTSDKTVDEVVSQIHDIIYQLLKAR